MNYLPVDGEKYLRQARQIDIASLITIHYLNHHRRKGARELKLEDIIQRWSFRQAPQQE